MHRLTQAPLPEWGDLLAAVVNSSSSEDVLAAPWCRNDDEAFWFSRSAWSLAIVARWRKQLASKESLIIWIPDFFCNASLAPLRDMGASLAFYPVTSEMTPDPGSFRNLAATHPPDIFILVHYFGQPTPAGAISAFCKEQNAWLIEDAVHALRPVPGIGETGDCVLYSPHKHLPIPDGAVLVVRSTGPARLNQQAQAMNVLREISAIALNSPGYSNKAAAIWLIKRMLQRLGLRSYRLAAAFRGEAKTTVSIVAHPQMSTCAKRLLTRLKNHLDVAALLRKQHALNWHQTLAWANPSGVLKPLPATTMPYLVGFSCDKEADAELSFDRLQRAGVPVTTWPDLPPEVSTRVDTHRAAISLRYSRMYLPVHQSLNQQQIFACGRSVLIDATTQWKMKALDQDEWENCWQRCSMSNLPQSWQYGAAKEMAEGWEASRFLISDDSSQPIALAQILTKGLPFIGYIARLNRGPLLLESIPKQLEVPTKLAALRVLLRALPRQRQRMMQVAPELYPTSEAIFGLQALGLKRLPALAWGSGRLALEADEQELLEGFNGKWRNCMRKGEKLGVTVTHRECNEGELELLLDSYTKLQNNRGFNGLPVNLIRALAKQKGLLWQFSLFLAQEIGDTEDVEPLGVLVTIRSGDTAIYLIGATNDKGRKMQANSVLLWQAVLHAKRSGCAWFDIGGLNKATPKGIAEFKQGLNAMPYELIGEWRKWC